MEDQLAFLERLQRSLGLLALRHRVFEQVQFGELAPPQVRQHGIRFDGSLPQFTGGHGHARESLYAREQVHIGDGARNEAVSAGGQALFLLLTAGEGGRRHDHYAVGIGRLGLDAPAHLEAVHARHVPVQQHDVGTAGRHQAQRLLAACR